MERGHGSVKENGSRVYWENPAGRGDGLSSRPSQDWNRLGSHRWNTGGGFEDRRDINSNWAASGLGTAGRVGMSYAGRGPKGYQRSDESIKEEICECLTADHHVDASNIEVIVQNGEVTLSGTVTEKIQKYRAEDAIDHLSGVTEVHNRLRVHKEGGSGHAGW